MGNKSGRQLSKAVTDKDEHAGEGKDLKARFGLSSCQGWRANMEDAHHAEVHDGTRPSGLFMVCDGHAGRGVALHVAKHLPVELQPAVEQLAGGDFKPRDLRKVVKQAFLDLDGRMRKINTRHATDTDDSGCTVTSAAVSSSHVLFANLGDSRGLLVRDGAVVFATKDHKPSDPDEEKRIVTAGGFVASDRVCRCLAVSRAMGDHLFKDEKTPPERTMVVAVPDVHITERHPDDEFILLGCDGVFDVYSNERLVKFVSNLLLEEPSLKRVCSRVVDSCLDRGSTDNISVLIVTLPAAKTANAVDELIDDWFDIDEDEDGDGDDDDDLSLGMAAASSSAEASASAAARPMGRTLSDQLGEVTEA